VLVNAGLIYLYFSTVQAIDEEEFGGAWELTKEGFMTSFAGFLVNIKLSVCMSVASHRNSGKVLFIIPLCSGYQPFTAR
jgi:hypothetical protein